jgi:alkanesulfonate monooxygenase SsuD/methylene tetrahydromethanopterin reductase-like flavin-dependent oxidoreductase (luciferase family)
VLRDPFAWDELAALARRGESLGFDALVLPEIAGRDAFATLTGLAAHTEALHLGTGVVPMTSRTARLTAMGAATVQERSAGRAILGIGTGGASRGALDRLRDYVGEVRAAFEGTLTLRVDVPPVWISALGPRAARLAGEVADGVLLNWCTPERVARAVAEVRDGAEGAGRDPSAIAVAVYVRGAIGDSAPDALRAAAAEYAAFPAYARQFEAMGLDPADPAGLAEAVCLPPDVERARARLTEYRDAGADLPLVYPVAAGGPASVAMTLEALAP